MEESTSKKKDRVGIYLWPKTRNRLNVFKAEISYAAGHVIPLDEAVNMLLEHYEVTATEQSERMAQVGR